MSIKNNIYNYKIKSKKIYYRRGIIKNAMKVVKEKNRKDYYTESVNALIEYMKRYEKNPNEKQWDKYAIQNEYLSSKTIGYLSEIGFNTFCRNLRKQINKEKRIS